MLFIWMIFSKPGHLKSLYMEKSKGNPMIGIRMIILGGLLAIAAVAAMLGAFDKLIESMI